ncbi:NAD(P)H-hydrate dehydratase [Opitutaceae bacterium TAV3]|nr:NAD(P)H-hydrate dehydratase [Opitutaceae bacterium TAV3]
MLESGGGKLGEEGLRPLAARAWAKLRAAAGERVRVRRALECGAGVPPAWSGGVPAAGRDDSPARSEATTGRAGARPAAGTPPLHIYDLVIDGVFGFQFRPPLSPELARVLAWANALPARLRAAVDLPSGLGEAGAFRADFTYATGIVKEPLVASGGLPNAGRLRYLNLGFFDEGEGGGGGEEVSENAPASARRPAKWVLTPAALAPLRELRAADSDKRTYGHVFLAGGSRSYPGAIFMAASAAVRSGAGLVTVFAPESLVAAFAARLPEAMWVACPETPEGGLALEGLHLVQERIGRATALVVGPGLGRERESLVLAEEMVKMSSAPVVIDADALQPQIVSAGTIPRILTPHAGELARIAERVPSSAVLVRKGPVTCIEAQGVSFYSFKGGPVLARGGSGDLLAGLMGGLLAQSPGDPAAAACRAGLWHGMARQPTRWPGPTARVAVRTTQLLDFLAVALRAEH